MCTRYHITAANRSRRPGRQVPKPAPQPSPPTPHPSPLTPHPSDHTPPSPLTPHLQTIPLSTPTPPPLPHVYRLVSSRLQAGTLTGADPEPSLGDASPICGDHAVDGSRPPFRLQSLIKPTATTQQAREVILSRLPSCLKSSSSRS